MYIVILVWMRVNTMSVYRKFCWLMFFFLRSFCTINFIWEASAIFFLLTLISADRLIIWRVWRRCIGLYYQFYMCKENALLMLYIRLVKAILCWRYQILRCHYIDLNSFDLELSPYSKCCSQSICYTRTKVTNYQYFYLNLFTYNPKWLK